MNLTTTYLGLTLHSPLVPSASPLTGDLDNIKRLEDGGAAAIILPSLFEEQLTQESQALHFHLTQGTYSFAEALTYFPVPADEFTFGPESYLEHIRQAKEAVDIPIIASLNGSSPGGWTGYARQMAQAGADALELNIYYIPTELTLTGTQVEQTYFDILHAVKAAVRIPVAVKLSPFFSNLAYMAGRLDEAGADALVLFNRFYQPDVDLDALEIRPRVLLSTPQALRLPLTWIGILYGRVQADLAATSGIHTAEDVVKMLMVGARVTLLCSALLKRGIGHLRVVEHDLRHWLEEHEYDSLAQLQGSMSQLHCPDPTAFERVQYIRALQTFQPQVAR
ncbi:MAG TPA: dihydroorotate dehydrogenase-like protein [Chloroflexia bacterium]|nr:dihydroorotate dehydrogenase-like protein [Chloroflexia bacterium]